MPPKTYRTFLETALGRGAGPLKRGLAVADFQPARVQPGRRGDSSAERWLHHNGFGP